jgi:hypothetical protein
MAKNPQIPNKVPLAELSRSIAIATGGAPAPSYRQLYLMILDGKLPSEKVRGRYQVDVRVAVKALGLQESSCG